MVSQFQVQAGLFNGVMSAINAADRSGYVKRTPDETLVASVLAEFHMVSKVTNFQMRDLLLSLHRFCFIVKNNELGNKKRRNCQSEGRLIVACFLIFACIPACYKYFSSADKQVVHEYNKEVGQ